MLSKVITFPRSPTSLSSARCWCKGEPLVHIYANSHDRGWVDETLREYRLRVQEFVYQEQGVEEIKMESVY